MTLTSLDWSIIVGYFCLTLLIGLYFRRRAGKNLDEFFVSGRALPWWIAGTSMVATTFAADTPLAVTGLIVKNGLAGNWFWWAFAVGGMFTVFVYARLWRRAEVITDVELIKLRYHGRPAELLRYTRATYIALIVNPIIIGWVIGAMLTVLQQTVFYDSPAYGESAPFWNQASLPWAAVIGMMVVVGVYSTMSGMWGVAVADVIQFCLAMGGCIWLAVVAVQHVGGTDQLQAKVEAEFGDRSVFDFLPSLQAAPSDAAEQIEVDPDATPAAAAVASANRLIDKEGASFPPKVLAVIERNRNAVVDQLATDSTVPGNAGGSAESANRLTAAVKQLESTVRKATPGPWMAVHVFLIMLTMQWWATWYPGAEPGGGGYVVQRMASCRDERHSVLATLWYQVAHYCIRPWPWIMISFVALAMYPELRANYIGDDAFKPEIGFPMVMRALCTSGLAGLMLVAFFAAFMSTMSTQMNWGASYLIRDVVQPLFMRDAGDRELATASRVVSIVILVVGIGFGYLMQGISVDDAWKLLAALGAGTGLVFMLRWFWWRINAWSEIVAMLASLIYFVLLNQTSYVQNWFGVTTLRSEEQMALIAAATIVTWLIATWLTPAESEETLRRFFVKIRPGGPGWKPIAALESQVEQDRHLGLSILAALIAATMVYLTLPAIGYLIFGEYLSAGLCIAVAGGLAWWLSRLVRTIYS